MAGPAVEQPTGQPASSRCRPRAYANRRSPTRGRAGMTRLHLTNELLPRTRGDHPSPSCTGEPPRRAATRPQRAGMKRRHPADAGNEKLRQAEPQGTPRQPQITTGSEPACNSRAQRDPGPVSNRIRSAGGEINLALPPPGHQLTAPASASTSRRHVRRPAGSRVNQTSTIAGSDASGNPVTSPRCDDEKIALAVYATHKLVPRPPIRALCARGAQSSVHAATHAAFQPAFATSSQSTRTRSESADFPAREAADAAAVAESAVRSSNIASHASPNP